MKAYFESLSCALNGLREAISTERNLKLFIIGVLLTFPLAAFLQLPLWQWIVLILSGGTFISMELMNTALEHFTDAFDSHSKKQQDIHFEAIKMTKDIAAAAALVTAGTWGLLLLGIFGPPLLFLIAK